MVTVEDVDVTPLVNEQCYPTMQDPQGRFPTVTITLSTGECVIGKTCECRQGHVSHGTWRLPAEGDVFIDKDDLMEFLENKQPSRARPRR